MSYNNRPRPNVSQYIANLNTIPSNVSPSQQQEAFPAEDELALFVNSDFFDFDVNEMRNMAGSIDFDPAAETRSRQQHATAFKGDVYNGGDFHYPEFSYQNINHDASAFSPTAPPAGHHPVLYPLATQLGSPTSATSPPSATGDKLKLDVLTDPLNQGPIDEQARMAAEEDKRRRNTAASARFRVKKKQREQALERTAKEMTEKVERLESRVQQLEMENKWLKGLITEKNDGQGGDMTEKYRQFTERDSRRNEEKKDGVGTKA